MSRDWWDVISDGIHALYETNSDFTDGVSDYLPAFLNVNGVPVPTQEALATLFGGVPGPTRDAYIRAFALNLARSQNGIAAVEQLERLGGGLTMQLIVPNVYRCTIQAKSGTRAVQNVIGLRGTAGGQEAAAAAALKAAWEAAGGPARTRPTQYLTQGYYVVDLSSANGGIATLAGAQAGLLAGHNSTNAACALVKLNGSNRSRSTRGRMYVGPLGEGEVAADGQTMNTTDRATLQSAVNQFKAALATAGFVWCVISVKNSSSSDVTAAQVETQIATQRRRIRV